MVSFQPYHNNLHRVDHVDWSLDRTTLPDDETKAQK